MIYHFFSHNEFQEDRLLHRGGVDSGVEVEGRRERTTREEVAQFADEELVEAPLSKLEEKVDETLDKKMKKVSEMPLEAQIFVDDYKKTTDAYRARFGKDLYGRNPEQGALMSMTLTMQGPKAMIRNRTKGHYDKYIAALGVQFQREMSQMTDQKEMKRLSQNADKALFHYDGIVRDMIRSYGSAEKGDNFIDTKKELDLWNRNGREVMEKLKPPSNLLRQSMEAPDGPQIDFDYMGNTVCAQSATLIQKIETGPGLQQGDYDTVISIIRRYYKADFDTQDMSKLEHSVRAIEDTGALAVVHAMNPRQRYTLAGRMIKKSSPTEASFGIRFLVKANFLSIGEGEEFLEKLGPKYAFKEKELKEIRELRTALKKLREQTSKTMGKVASHNMALEHFTASNGILYEVIFRFAGLGVILPYLFTINRPSQWGQIATNPFWLASVAVAGLTADHVTGGIGKGLVTQGITSIGMPKADKETSDIEKRWEVFRGVVLNNPETIRYLSENNGERIAAIHERAHDESKTEDPQKFKFKYEDFPEWDKSEQDGRGVKATEDAISNIYRHLMNDTSLAQTSTTKDILKLFKEAQDVRFDPLNPTFNV